MTRGQGCSFAGGYGILALIYQIGSYKGETLWDYLVKAKKSEKKSI